MCSPSKRREMDVMKLYVVRSLVREQALARRPIPHLPTRPLAEKQSTSTDSLPSSSLPHPRGLSSACVRACVRACVPAPLRSLARFPFHSLDSS